MPSLHPPAIPDGTVTALVVDGHTSSRLGLAVLLRNQRWVSRCLLARDAGEGAELAQRHRPDVALLDVSEAGPFAASAAARLRAAHPGIQIVLTSRCATRFDGSPRAIGATSFLPPSASAEEIVTAVGCAVVTPEAPVERPSAQRHELTARERELLSLISTGATNREIALRLRLGTDSVKKNASTLYRKLGVRNRTEAARRAPEVLATS
jgi:DNA-binding NarL/FixJ family response regulator